MARLSVGSDSRNSLIALSEIPTVLESPVEFRIDSRVTNQSPIDEANTGMHINIRLTSNLLLRNDLENWRNWISDNHPNNQTDFSFLIEIFIID